MPKPKAKERDQLLEALQHRFEQNMSRHKGIAWKDVLARLDRDSDAVDALFQMEATGGEPDVIGRDAKSGAYLFSDCAPESPTERRSLCFDGAALASRKANKPKGNAVDAAAAMGIELLTEEDYHALQRLGPFDTKTSSWIATPSEVRELGGALFGDRRFGRVFIYHNGAESYYAARGFRGMRRV